MNERHGSYTAYARRGCRCAPCVEYQRARVARNRAERRARAITHGNRSSYDAGCRCNPCWEARKAAYPRERAQAREKREASA